MKYFLYVSSIQSRYNNEESIIDTAADGLETPDAFLKALGESLMTKDRIDADLASIVATHILKAAPAQNAVTQAKDAIIKLAAERAKLPIAEI